MTGTLKLRATFDERCAEIGLDDTLALPGGATIRADVVSPASVAAPPAAWTLPDPQRLPRLALAAAAAAQPAPGPTSRSDLELKELIGEGGMGRVHAVRQHSLARDVAVKTMRPEALNPTTVKSLLREAVVTGSLEHPSIVPVHALGLDASGAPVLVMKRVEGTSWLKRLAGNPVSSADLDKHIEILMRVCRALEFAHSRGVLHRDIKP